MKAAQLSDHMFTPFNEAVRFLSQSTEDGGIYGLVGSAPAFLTSAAVRNGARTLVMVLPDGDTAARCAADVRFYLGEAN